MIIKNIERGLLFKNGNLQQVLMPGNYSFIFGDVKRFNILERFVPETNINIMLENKMLSDQLNLIEVKEFQIALYLVEGNLKEVLKTGKYAFWKSSAFGEVKIYNLADKFEFDNNLIHLLENKLLTDNLNIYDIKENQIGLYYSDNKLKEVLRAGKYAFWKSPAFGEVKIYNLADKFLHLNNLKILLQNELLNNELLIHEIKDNEIGLYLCDKNFKEVLKSGVYAFWKSTIAHEIIKIDLNNPFIEKNIDKQLLNRLEILAYINIFIIEPFEKGLFFIDKKFEAELEPGRYYFWKGSKDIRIDKVDMRQNQINIAGQEIMSKDKVTLRFNFVCQYKIVNPYIAIHQVVNFTNEIYVLLQLVLREYVGAYTLDEILLKKEEISEYITNKLKSKVLELGIDLIFAGVKDVILPGDIKDILNQVLIAEKKAQANVIMRREETASTRSLLNTAKLMEDNELLFKLKELEYIERISEKISQISISGGTQFLEQLKQIFMPIREKELPKNK